jgi:hypothetical protein
LSGFAALLQVTLDEVEDVRDVDRLFDGALVLPDLSQVKAEEPAK